MIESFQVAAIVVPSYLWSWTAFEYTFYTLTPLVLKRETEEPIRSTVSGPVVQENSEKMAKGKVDSSLQQAAAWCSHYLTHAQIHISRAMWQP